MIPYYELRIGNCVLVKNKLQRIATLNSKASMHAQPFLEIQANASEDYGHHAFEDVQPVPLSEEVLKQCGFLYHDYFKFWQLITRSGTNRSEMDMDNDYSILDFMRRPLVKEVASLHQLQNIYFMLHGKELDFQATA